MHVERAIGGTAPTPGSLLSHGNRGHFRYSVFGGALLAWFLLGLFSLPTGSYLADVQADLPGPRLAPVAPSGNDLFVLAMGPNDGELLGGQVPFHFQSTYVGETFLVLHVNETFASAAWYAGSVEGNGPGMLHEIVSLFDSREFQNGAVTIQFHLYAGDSGALLGVYEHTLTHPQNRQPDAEFRSPKNGLSRRSRRG